MPRNGSRFTEAHGRGATLALLILAALAVAACSSGVDIGSTTLPTPSPEPAETTDEATTVADEPDLPVLSDLEAPEWRPATRTEELALDIDEAGEPTPQHAVDAFGLLVDGMPGTTPTDLPPGEALGETYTLLLIRAFRDQLTPEQQLVVDEHLDAGTVIATIAADGTIEIAPEESEIDDDPADDPTPGPSGLRHSGPPATTTDVEALAALLGGVQEAWNQRLPGHPSFGIELAKTDLPLKQIDALPKDNDPRTCVISVHAGFLGAAPSDDQLRWAFAHELFHCMQFIWQTAQLPPPDWLIEGSADFAATDLFRTATLDYDGLGHQWFTEAEAPLVARTYSAWGLFENASVSGLDAYARIEAMVASPAQTVGQFLTAGQLDGLIFRKDWSTRTLRSNSLGPTWQLGWPKPDAGFGPHDNVFSHGARGVGTYNILGAGRFSHLQNVVQMTPDVGLVTVTPNGGPLTTETAGGPQTVRDGATRKFCFAADGCRCPEGTSAGAVPMAGPDMIFSYAATFGGTVAAVRAEEWDPDRECSDEPDTTEAYSNGDPHLVSFDGLPFDVVTLGEFVTARDPEGGFEVQTRHEPFESGAGTTAVALGTGENRITFTMPEFFALQLPEVRVDGAVTTGTDLTVGDVRVIVDATEIVATWPDGSTVELSWFLGWFVKITVPSERAGRMEGLLGSADGNMANDLVMPDGMLVDTIDAAAHESSYALTWSVDEATTLFDYGPGQSPATFRIPHPNPDPPEIDDDAIAECSDALGESAAAHELSSCAYDVSVTGEAGFAVEYASIVEDRVGDDTERVFVPQATATPTPAGPAAESQAGVPTLTLSDDQPVGTVDVVEGTVLFARAASCTEGVFVDIAVYSVDSRDEFAVAALCDPQGLGAIGADEGEWTDGEAYVWLPGSRTYEVEVTTLSFSPDIGFVEIYTDPDPVVVRAADLTAGDRRVLDGIADTVVYLPDPATTFDAGAFEEACAVPVYWGAEEFPRDEPFNLDVCEHSTGIDFPPTDMVIPVVVFNRTDTPIEVELTPTG